MTEEKKSIGMRKERRESRRRQDGPEDGGQEITFSRPEELPKSRGKTERLGKLSGPDAKSEREREKRKEKSK